MIKICSAVTLSITLTIGGCGDQQSSTSTQPSQVLPQLSGKLIVTGSSTIAPLAAELAKEFEKLNTNTKIDVQTGGSSRGIADVKQGISNIGMVSRSLKINENDLTAHLVAQDGVSIIVHKDNPINELSDKQIKDIYLGKINNWKNINGVDKKITVINKAEGRSTLEVFTKYFDLKNTLIKPDIIIGDNEQAVKLVAKNPNAIAYVSIGTAEYDMKLGITIKTLALNGIAASTVTLRNKQFPLSRELNFVTIGVPTMLAQAFIDYTQSQAANSIIEGFGFVPTQP